MGCGALQRMCRQDLTHPPPLVLKQVNRKWYDSLQMKIKQQIVHSVSVSDCCHAPQQLVRSRSGNFVTRNCTKCGKSAKRLSLSDIPQVLCPWCSLPLKVGYIGKSYGCRCRCGHGFELGDILPCWEDAGFEYCGVAAPGDPSYPNRT